MVTSAYLRQDEPPRGRTALRVLACVLALAVCAAPIYAVSVVDEEKELQIRAAFLLNFIKFTEWPEETFEDGDDAFVIAVVGPDPFGRVLEQTFAQLKVHERKVTIRRWSLPSPADYESSSDYEEAAAELQRRIQAAHLVYLTVCEPEELDLALEGVDTSRVLTVGSEYRCAVNRTALALDRNGERMVFYANTRILKSLKLRISSRLLSLAKLIGESGRQEGEP